MSIFNAYKHYCSKGCEDECEFLVKDIPIDEKFNIIDEYIDDLEHRIWKIEYGKDKNALMEFNAKLANFDQTIRNLYNEISARDTRILFQYELIDSLLVPWHKKIKQIFCTHKICYRVFGPYFKCKCGYIYKTGE